MKFSVQSEDAASEGFSSGRDLSLVRKIIANYNFPEKKECVDE